jgi:hypothetical protein
MPNSYPYFKKEFKFHLIKNFESSMKILDVGPGSGSYSKLLKENFKNMDCIEIWEPYIKQYNLKSMYENVYLGNIVEFEISNYDYLIIGDVLEHLSIDDSQNLMCTINENNKKCMVAVPYLYRQGPWQDNVHETHLQPDLTHEVFLSRYKNMKCLFKIDLNRTNGKGYGYYINY